ncbi:MAG TPA: hypothetical protein PLK12_13410, partial [Prolixibacteraceae bacterium]|nr:hypothetical protein [Prolixibacteraceae bacterium]
MKIAQLVLRNIRHFWAPNFWVAIGIAISTTVLTGGLIVGDSVIHSLEQSARLRLGNISHALVSGERFFTSDLALAIDEDGIPCSAALNLSGIVSSDGGQLKLNPVDVWGVDSRFSLVSSPSFPAFSVDVPDSLVFSGMPAFVSENMARRLNLKPGDPLLLRVGKVNTIPANAPFVSDKDPVVSFRVWVQKILNISEMGRLNLRNSQTAPFTIFLPLNGLSEQMGLQGRANTLLLSTGASVGEIEGILKNRFTLDDAGLTIREAPLSDQWEIVSDRVFIDDASVTAMENTGLSHDPILTYFVNSFRFGERETPYSFISSLPGNRLGEGEIIINEWLSGDLDAGASDSLVLNFYRMGSLRELEEVEISLRVKEVVPL